MRLATGEGRRFWVDFWVRRVARLVLLLLAVALVAFAIAKSSPVDPVDAYLGTRVSQVSPEQRAIVAQRWGFDEPAATQFLKWAGNIATGEMGRSSIYNAPVADVVWTRFQASLALMGLAWLFSAVIGFGLGILAGAREGSRTDRAIRVYAYVLASTPTFWIAILLVLVFSVSLGWTPVCCAGPPGVAPADVSLLDRLRHLALPVAALSILGIAQIALHTRAKMIEAMRSDYALFAFAQGASRTDVALRHGARNAALPAITIMFASLGELFGGSLLAEQVFAYPGIGRATVEAGLRGDVPLLLAITLVATLFVSVGNTIADALYHVVDPRLRPDAGAPA